MYWGCKRIHMNSEKYQRVVNVIYVWTKELVKWKVKFSGDRGDVSKIPFGELMVLLITCLWNYYIFFF